MAAADSGDVIIVIGVVIILSQTMENVMALRVTAPGGGLTTTQVGTLVRDYMGQVYGLISSDITNGVTWREIQVKNRTQGTDVGIYAWDTSGFAGGSGNQVLPGPNAALVTLPTSRAKTRGRKFFPGMTTFSLTGSAVWATSLMTHMALLGGFLLAPRSGVITGASLQYCVVSEGVGAFTTYLPTAAQVRSVPAVQRRRKVGVGI